MKKIKTSTLEGDVLNWAVAKAEHDGAAISWLNIWLKGGDIRFVQTITNSPSTNWAQGGLIIDDNKIAIDYVLNECIATMDCWDNYTSGSTPLIAAMRCYVRNKLGEEIEVPEELL